MIKSFKNKSIQKLYYNDDRSKVNKNYASKIVRVLDRLDASVSPNDMNLPGYKLHQLSGKQKGTWSVWISGNWRITFQFDGKDFINIDFKDYH